ncbi:unnamed protein product [Darwinula stevensoni]|uniref:Wbp11/ELF5/Saf1 N-terminal domain-containing protein n=1 Tax=Darwinula stevensoni TaxID=69355 RepID=A0A7R9A8J0_9CRUS|nr:unnamed protein product [Darwinula stevensoni]CAG0896391.1 unnamed protein product [Darwinula stevensoni]
MGRRSINTTKSGKYMNPTDQARKEARKRELKKNKKQRMMVRAAVLKNKDPHQIIADLESIDHMEFSVDHPPALNEKVLKEKRKKLCETLERIVKLYEKEDPERWAEIRRMEAEYEKKRLQMMQYHESVKFAQQVAVDEIPLPSVGMPMPMPAQIPLPPVAADVPHIPFPPGPGILKRTGEKALGEERYKEPPGVPSGPPPILSDAEEGGEESWSQLDDQDAYEGETEVNPPVPGEERQKRRKIRFADEKREGRDEGEGENEGDKAIPPSSIQQKMLTMAGQDIDEFMKEMEAVHRERQAKKDAELRSRLSRVGETPGHGHIPPPPPPSIPPPGMMFRSLPPTGLRLPPGPPPVPTRMRLPPGPPPGLPPPRLVQHPQSVTATVSGSNPNVLSAAPRLIKRTEGEMKTSGPTIEAKPQLRLHLVLQLQMTDVAKYHDFAFQPLAWLEVDVQWFSNDLWTSEAHFNLSDVNPKNCICSSITNPYATVQQPLHDSKVMVWHGFTFGFILEPYFFVKANETGQKMVTIIAPLYHDLPMTKAISELHDCGVIEQITFMQYNALPNIATHSKQIGDSQQNLSAEVTKLVPTALRVKREDKFGLTRQRTLPSSLRGDRELRAGERRSSTSMKSLGSKDDAYVQFMKEMEGLM